MVSLQKNRKIELSFLKMKRSFFFAALMTALSTNGQSMDALLKSVEQNNAQLIAYKKAADATKSANHA